MTTVHIGLPARGLALTSERPSSGPPDALVAELRCESLVAVTTVYDTQFHGLATYVADIATDWRGWQGQREWHSLEGDLGLAATYVGSNVALRVTLASQRVGWSATGELTIEPGEQLTRISAELSSLAAGEGR